MPTAGSQHVGPSAPCCGRRLLKFTALIIAATVREELLMTGAPNAVGLASLEAGLGVIAVVTAVDPPAPPLAEMPARDRVARDRSAYGEARPFLAPGQ